MWLGRRSERNRDNESGNKKKLFGGQIDQLLITKLIGVQRSIGKPCGFQQSQVVNELRERMQMSLFSSGPHHQLMLKLEHQQMRQRFISLIYSLCFCCFFLWIELFRVRGWAPTNWVWSSFRLSRPNQFDAFISFYLLLCYLV